MQQRHVVRSFSVDHHKNFILYHNRQTNTSRKLKQAIWSIKKFTDKEIMFRLFKFTYIINYRDQVKPHWFFLEEEGN